MTTTSLSLATVLHIQSMLKKTVLPHVRKDAMVISGDTESVAQQLEKIGGRIKEATERGKKHFQAQRVLHEAVNQISQQTPLIQEIVWCRKYIQWLESELNNDPKRELKPLPERFEEYGVSGRYSIQSNVEEYLKAELEEAREEAAKLQKKLDEHNRSQYLEVPQFVMEYLEQYDYI